MNLGEMSMEETGVVDWVPLKRKEILGSRTIKI